MAIRYQMQQRVTRAAVSSKVTQLEVLATKVLYYVTIGKSNLLEEPTRVIEPIGGSELHSVSLFYFLFDRVLRP